MKTYRILTVALAVMLLIGCGKAKFAEEKTVMITATKAMETLTAAISLAGGPAEVTSAVNAFSDQIEKIAPALKTINEEHKEWETDPPPELKETVEKLMSASQGMQGIMPKLMQMASQHADDTELQGALQKFQTVLGGL
jgi:hypothetical protein